jgi:putative resolvase
LCLQKKNNCDTRVSGSNQKNDLSSQKAALEQFVIAQGINVEEWRSDSGSGLNYERKQFNLLLEAVEKNQVAKIIIAPKDRFVRFGDEWNHNDCQRHGCEIVVINVESLSPQQEVVKDLLTIIDCFSSRLYGLRGYKKERKTMIGDQEPDA